MAQEGELYVLAQSRDRVAKERAMRRRQLKRLWAAHASPETSMACTLETTETETEPRLRLLETTRTYALDAGERGDDLLDPSDTAILFI